MTDAYIPAHLFRPGGTVIDGHQHERPSDLGIFTYCNPEQWAQLRATVDARLARWDAASPEEREYLPPVLTWMSDGGGTQSTAIKLMVEAGDLPRPDVCIFADTQYESDEVYEGLRWLHSGNGPVRIPFVAVTKGSIYTEQAIDRVAGNVSGDRNRFAALPYFTKHAHEERAGMVKRQCTSEYKIEPVLKVARTLLGLQPRQRVPRFGIAHSVQWLGISLDEIQRAKQSTHDWLRIEHPLIDARLSRADCLEWMRRREYPKPPRSACISCPLRSREEWVDLRDQRPREFASAVRFDKSIRFATDMDRPCYVHRSCVPLEDVDLSGPHEGQGDLWAGCDSGWCGT